MNGSIADVLSGRARWVLICADNAKILPFLPARSVDHVITDPPYAPRVLAGARGLRAHGSILAREFGYASLTTRGRRRVAKAIQQLCTRWCLVFCDTESAVAWGDDLEPGVRHVRIGAWVRPNAAPQFTGDRPGQGFEACAIGHARAGGRYRWNGGGAPALWTHNVVNGNSPERLHPTPKPLSLMLEIVSQFTDPGDLVCDPFAGSGTTGAACVRLGRRFIGIERDAAFAAIAADRIEAESRGQSHREFKAGQIPLFTSRRVP